MGSGGQVSGGQVSGIAGGSEQLSAGVSGLVKKNLDCTVGKLIVYPCSGVRHGVVCWP